MGLLKGLIKMFYQNYVIDCDLNHIMYYEKPNNNN